MGPGVTSGLAGGCKALPGKSQGKSGVENGICNAEHETQAPSGNKERPL